MAHLTKACLAAASQSLARGTPASRALPCHGVPCPAVPQLGSSHQAGPDPGLARRTVASHAVPDPTPRGGRASPRTALASHAEASPAPPGHVAPAARLAMPGQSPAYRVMPDLAAPGHGTPWEATSCQTRPGLGCPWLDRAAQQLAKPHHGSPRHAMRRLGLARLTKPCGAPSGLGLAHLGHSRPSRTSRCLGPAHLVPPCLGLPGAVPPCPVTANHTKARITPPRLGTSCLAVPSLTTPQQALADLGAPRRTGPSPSAPRRCSANLGLPSGALPCHALAWLARAQPDLVAPGPALAGLAMHSARRGWPGPCPARPRRG